MLGQPVISLEVQWPCKTDLLKLKRMTTYLSELAPSDILAIIGIICAQGISILAALHAVMTKRDPRSAAGWAALILLTPFGGAILYWLLGINRIERKAKKIYKQDGLRPDSPDEAPPTELPENLRNLCALTRKVVGMPLRHGNQVDVLINGDEAYPAMLKSIREAKNSIHLSTFIFDNDEAGADFLEALREASERGVETLVLIDDIGSRYSFPTIFRKFKKTKVIAKRFHKVVLPWSLSYSQLRSHRKLLIIDNESAFLGGMNIRIDHVLSRAKENKKTSDLHFRVKGPIIEDLFKIFAQDWKFSVKETLPRPSFRIDNLGQSLMRVSPSGPHENQNQLRWSLLGAINSAKTSLSVLTPYFLPDQELLSALGAASLRGVKVEIILPQKNNHALAHWACMGNLWQVLETGCEVYFSQGPFDHSKLLIVDEYFTFFGSGNWDARSFRLNFELNVECYDPALASELYKIFTLKRSVSRRLTNNELKERSFPVKMRDALARLLTPYL